MGEPMAPSLTFLSIGTRDTVQPGRVQQPGLLDQVVEFLQDSDRPCGKAFYATAKAFNRCMRFLECDISQGNLKGEPTDIEHLEALRSVAHSVKDYQHVMHIDCRTHLVQQDIEKFNDFIRWMNEASTRNDSIGAFVRCLRQNHMKILVVINNSETLKQFIGVCDGLVGYKSIFFSLGRFSWDPIFSGAPDILGRVEAIAAGAQQTDVNIECLNLSPLSGLREIGHRAFQVSTSRVDLGGCTKLRTIGNVAFKYTKGSVDLSHCTQLQTIGHGAFLDLKADVYLSGCSQLHTIGALAFCSSKTTIEDIGLSGCTNLRTIGGCAFLEAKGGVDLSGCAALSSIGEAAFSSATGRVTLRNCTQLLTVGRRAFGGAKGSVTLSKCIKLHEIGEEAFIKALDVDLQGCISLETIGPSAFKHAIHIFAEGSNDKLEAWVENGSREIGLKPIKKSAGTSK